MPIYPVAVTYNSEYGYHVQGDLAFTSVGFNQFYGIFSTAILQLANICGRGITLKALL